MTTNLEDGVYLAVAVSWGLGLTSTGKEQLGVEFEFLDERLAGQRITWFGYFTDRAFDVTLKALRTLGWQGSDLSDLRDLDSNQVNLVIENEEYQGRYYPRVRWINPLNSGIPLRSQMDPNAARSFAERMKGRILAAEQSGGQTGAQPAQQRRSPPPPAQSPRQQYAAPQHQQQPPPHSDDDIPF